MGHSPEQIAGRLALEHGRVIISHELIYRFIYHRTAQKDYWHRLLPRHKLRRGRRRRPGGSPASFIKQRRSIAERPARSRAADVGHWEADFMLFARYGQGLLVLHERQTRFSIVLHPLDRKAVLTARTIARQLGKLPQTLRKTISFDNGTEFAEHHRLHNAIGVQTFFATPIAPGKKAAWKIPSGACDAPCHAKPTSIPSPQPPSVGSLSVSMIPHANAWTSRHPPRHSPNSNQSLHFKRDSIYPPSRG